VKLSSAGGNRFVFQLARREQLLLQAVLRLYPVVPPAHHRISKSAPASPGETNQGLLDEALAEQRQQGRRKIEALLGDTRRFSATQSGCSLKLSSADLEWLLQILNDVRVGSWIALGAPDQGVEDMEINDTSVRHMWAMEMAGHFQMGLLAALNRET
jgi:hypothetical protein